MYCIGGFILGAILAVPVAVLVVRQRAQDERLAQEAKKRQLAWEHDEDEHLAASRLRLREMKARQKT